MDELSFEVLGKEPVPKQSFRFSKHGGYQPERVREWEAWVQAHALQAMGGEGPSDGYFEVVLTFYRKSKRKVDLDNLSKGVLDALNGVCWHDDRQVFRLTLSKCYVSAEELAGVKVEMWREDEDGDLYYS